MNTLGYVARQFDGLAKTPPSTPTREQGDLPRVSSWSTRSLLFNNGRTRPQRSQSSPHFASTSATTTATTTPPKPPPTITIDPPTLTVVTPAPPRSKKHIETVIDQIFFLRVFLLVWDHLKSAWSSLAEGIAVLKWRLDVKGKGKAIESNLVLEPALLQHSLDSARTATPTLESLSPPATATSRSTTPTLSARKTPFHRPKTLVLDLDETLIHSTSRPISVQGGSGLISLGSWGKGDKPAGHMVEVVLQGRSTLYHVYKRPFVDFFLRTVSSWYTLVIFTASMQEYADPVIDWLDAGRGIFAHRFFRDSCKQLTNGSYTKDLRVVEPDLSRVCLVDNSPVSYTVNEGPQLICQNLLCTLLTIGSRSFNLLALYRLFNKSANGIPIEGWTHDPSDEALLDLLPVLDSLRFTSDVRRVLGLRKAGAYILEVDSS
ncbi:NLI interacting factor-like phosphatase-domain-containing protein [Crepidotus variabilis]|uniref:NLI interacting factor-like phosphatase-domain-containing protein n=1 Tax=Crepidotus variabilis TaxID=179855 RepID=A0A9P6EUE8_9AGAR|nr:NLI interacting factor-like phosphatase-domain-containing protein [Crepidotus variabilis]